MRRILRTSILATSSLVVVGCFDPPVDLTTEASTDAMGSESGAPLPEPLAGGSTSTGAAVEPGTSSGAEGSTGAVAEADSGTTSVAGSSSSDEGSTSGTSDASETSAGVMSDGSSSGEPCGLELPMLLWAEDATVTAPMQLAVAEYLPDMPMMARSYAAEAGTVTFEVVLSCPAELTVFGLVWDFTEGAEPQNADSYYVTVDGLPIPEPVWAYGCETVGLGSESWSWQTLTEWTGIGCASNPYDIVLGAGAHEITLRNREEGGGINAAAIAAIVVTDDPGLDPATLYDPGP